MSQQEEATLLLIFGLLFRIGISSVIMGTVFHVAANKVCGKQKWVPGVGKSIAWYLLLATALGICELLLNLLLQHRSSPFALIVSVFVTIAYLPIHWAFFHFLLRFATPRQSLLTTLLSYGLIVGALLAIGAFGWLVITLTW